MPRARSRSLYLTVVLPTLAIVLVSMAAVSFVARQVMQEGVRNVASQRAKHGLACIRHSVEDIEHVMQVDHGIRLQDELERLGADPDMDAVRILSVAGKVLYSSRREEVGTMMPAHVPALPDPLPENGTPLPPEVRELPGLIHAAAPVLNRPNCATCHAGDAAILGIVDVDISLSRQSAGMKTWGRIAGIATVLQFALVAAGVALVLGVVVVKPVRRLERAMGEVRLGDYGVSGAPAGTKEIDSLVSGFNEMVGRLKRADQLEREAQRATMARAEQLASLGEWATSLAHELRNPLSGIKAAIDVLAIEERAEEPRRVLQHASSELARVDGVVRQLLDYARPKAPALGQVDLCSVLLDAVMLSKPRAAARHAVLESALPDRPIAVLADPEMVQQVVLNLILNGLEATDGTPDARVAVSAEVREGEAWCRVLDNGPGVPAARAAGLFRPFITTRAHGTGLGLATSRRLVELQGGRLVLENPGEAGASFAFSLPLFRNADPV
jgi:signal transduction histidine kinase